MSHPPHIGQPVRPADLVAFRKRYFFTQRELADAIGSCREHVSLYERGARSIPLDTERELKAFFSFVTLCAETGRL